MSWTETLGFATGALRVGHNLARLNRDTPPGARRTPHLDYKVACLSDGGTMVLNARARRESRLRIGTASWGYNHVKPKHGWDSVVRAQVAQILAAPIGVESQGDAYAYVGTYVSPSLGVDCVRKGCR